MLAEERESSIPGLTPIPRAEDLKFGESGFVSRIGAELEFTKTESDFPAAEPVFSQDSIDGIRDCEKLLGRKDYTSPLNSRDFHSAREELRGLKPSMTRLPLKAKDSGAQVLSDKISQAHQLLQRKQHTFGSAI